MFVDQIMELVGKGKRARGVRSVYGWITPENEFVRTDMHDHFPELKKRGLYTELFEQFAIAKNGYNEDYLSFTEYLDPDEHPGWHRFYSDNEDSMNRIRREILWMAYNDGWRRLAIVNKYGGGGKSLIMEMEGTQVFLNRSKKDMEYLADLYGCDLSLTPVTKPL